MLKLFRLQNSLLMAMITFVIAFSSASVSAITINEVIEQSILTNPAILEKYNQKISREYEVREVHGNYLPQVDLNSSAGLKRVNNETTRTTGDTSPDTYQSWDTSVSLKQMIFDGFLTSSEKSRQLKRVESAFFELYNLAEETAISSIVAYTNVLLYQKFRDYAEQNLASHQKMFDQIEMRSLLGADDKSALTQSRGRLNLAYSNVESERNNLEDRWTEYVEIVGFLPKDAIQDVEFDLTLPESYTEVLDYALANHPALARSKADIEQFKLQQKSSKSFYYPKVEFELKNRWLRNSRVDNSNTSLRTDEQSALINLSWNLYNGGSDRAKIRRDQFLHQEADEHLEWQRRRVQKDVSFAWNTYQSSSRRLKFLEQYVSATEETSVSYLDQFKIGERTLLDLLNIENEVFESRKEYLTVKYENIVAKYRVLASMGILLEKTKIKVVTDEYYSTDDFNHDIVNDLDDKNIAHDQRELKKRNSPAKFCDMRYLKMNNNLRMESRKVALKKEKNLQSNDTKQTETANKINQPEDIEQSQSNLENELEEELKKDLGTIKESKTVDIPAVVNSDVVIPAQVSPTSPTVEASQDLVANAELVTNQEQNTDSVSITTDQDAEEYDAFISSLPSTAKKFVLYFLTGTTRLMAESRERVIGIQSLVSDSESVDIHIIGHTDTQGTQENNKKLGLDRAGIVAEILMEGLNTNQKPNVKLRSYGESVLLIKTEDEVKNLENRRVEVILDF